MSVGITLVDVTRFPSPCLAALIGIDGPGMRCCILKGTGVTRAGIKCICESILERSPGPLRVCLEKAWRQVAWLEGTPPETSALTVSHEKSAFWWSARPGPACWGLRGGPQRALECGGGRCPVAPGWWPAPRCSPGSIAAISRSPCGLADGVGAETFVRSSPVQGPGQQTCVHVQAQSGPDPSCSPAGCQRHLPSYTGQWMSHSRARLLRQGGFAIK